MMATPVTSIPVEIQRIPASIISRAAPPSLAGPAWRFIASADGAASNRVAARPTRFMDFPCGMEALKPWVGRHLPIIEAPHPRTRRCVDLANLMGADDR